MSTAAVGVDLLRDPVGVGVAARLFSTLHCARCEAEGYSSGCPNCSGVSRTALKV